MAQDEVNFPFDQEKTSALRGLEQSREEVARPRRLDDAEEDLRNPGRAREAAAEEERDVSRLERIEDRVEITQDAFDQNQAAERKESLNKGFQLGNTQINPNGAVEFSARNQIDNPEEAIAATNELDSNSTSRAKKARNETRETVNKIADSPERQNVELQQRVEADSAKIRGNEEVEIQEDDLSEIRANVSEARAEQRAEDAREAARNEPPFDVPEAYVEQIEEVRDPLQEAQNTNPLRAPGPSEIRDEPDATAIETERGQNVSNLI